MAASRSGGKSAAAFRTISEVSEELDVPQHVLRFWETKFNQVKPLKRGGGRRYYRPEDVELLRRIRGLLYNDGYTIKGVQKLLREHGGRAPLPHDEAGLPPAPPLNGGPEQDEPSTRVRTSEGTRRAPKRAELETAISELQALSDRLKTFLR